MLMTTVFTLSSRFSKFISSVVGRRGLIPMNSVEIQTDPNVSKKDYVHIYYFVYLRLFS